MYVVVCKRIGSYLDRHSHEIRRIIGRACLLLVDEVKPFDDWANVIRFIISRYTSSLMWMLMLMHNVEVVRGGEPSVFAFLVYVEQIR